MSELKARLLGQTMNEHGCDTKIYLKSEADKVIAELEERLNTTEKLLNKALDCVSDGKNHIINLARKNSVTTSTSGAWRWQGCASQNQTTTLSLLGMAKTLKKITEGLFCILLRKVVKECPKCWRKLTEAK